MKRVLHVFSSLNKGGAESRVMDLYRLLDKMEVQFDFAVTSAGDGFYADEIRSMGGNIYVIPSWHDVGVIGWLQAWKKVFASACLVHSHTGFDSGIIAFVAWSFGVKKRISHARDMLPVSGRFGKIRESVLRQMMSWFSTDLIACSHESGEFIFGKHTMAKRGIFLPNAIDLDQYQEEPFDRDAYRENLGVAKDALLIGTVGNLREVKNQKFMIDILATFYQHHQSAELIIAGEGEMRQSLTAYAEHLHMDAYVHLLGQRHDIKQLLRCMDVFLMTSFSEGLPGSAVEAQCMNIPCVLSSAITRDVDAQSGLVCFVSLDSAPEVWMNQILEQASTPKPDRRETLRLLREKNFDVHESLKKLLSVYFDGETSFADEGI